MSYSREQRKWAAKRRAEFALETAFRRIDFNEDVVKPELEELAAGTAKLKLTGDARVDAREALTPTTPEIEA